MQYVDPDFIEYDAILGEDGCVYRKVANDGSWEKLFTYDGWKDYVVRNYQDFINEKINLDELVHNLTYIDEYKKVSGYNDKIIYHIFGSCQYHSIYKMYFLLQVLSHYGLDLKKIINCEPSEFTPLPNYEKNLINEIKANEFSYLETYGTVLYGIYKNEGIVRYLYDKGKFEKDFDKENEEFEENLNENITNIFNNKNNSKYIYLPSSKKWRNQLSGDKKEIFDKKHVECMIKLKDYLKIFNLPEEVLNEMLKRYNDIFEIKYKISNKEKLDDTDIVWDADDLLSNNGIVHLEIPLEYVPPNDRQTYLEYFYQEITSIVKKISKINDVRSAIKYYMHDSGGDMWYNVPKIFKTIYQKEIECHKAPTIKSDKLLNDWSDNYQLGAMIYVMVKNGITKYATDFYCPNT